MDQRMMENPQHHRRILQDAKLLVLTGYNDSSHHLLVPSESGRRGAQYNDKRPPLF
jgi:hypothetical protein